MAGLGNNVQLRDIASGYGLFTASLGERWEIVGTSLGAQQTSSKPYAPHVELSRPADGAVMRLDSGPAGTRNSTGANIMTAMYGVQTIGIDSTNYADMPDPSDASAAYALAQLAGVGTASGLHYDRPVSLGDPGEEVPLVAEVMHRQLGDPNGFMPTGDPFVARTLHLYRFDLGGEPWRMAVFTRMYAAKLGGFDMGAIGDALGGIVGSIGQAFGAFAGRASGQVQQAGAGGLKGILDFGLQGGLIGAALRGGQQGDAVQASQQQVPFQPAPAQQQAATPAPLGCTHDFAAYTKSGTIVWSIETQAACIGLETDFEERLAEFIPFALSARLHSDVVSLTSQFVAREAAAIQNSTNVALSQSQARFQAQQAAHQRQQAAYDSYNQAWQARSDAHHQAFRAATNAQFSTPAPGAGAPDYSEAIRGVNTYTTSDGREVEVSTHADRAWENQAGDVIGTSGGFEPGADWTELPRT